MSSSSFLKEKVNDNTTQHVIRMLVVESEQKYQKLVEHALVGIFITDLSSILYGNPYMERLIGYSLQEAKHLTLLDLIDPSCRADVSEKVAQRRRGASEVDEYETKLLHRDGHCVDVRVRTVNCMFNGKPAVLGTAIDITQKKTAEAKLRELTDLIESVPIAILKIDSDGRVAYSNQEASRSFDASEDKIAGRHLTELLANNNSEKIVDELLMSVRKSNRWVGKFEMNDTNVEMDVTAIPVVDKDDSPAGATLILS